MPLKNWPKGTVIPIIGTFLACSVIVARKDIGFSVKVFLLEKDLENTLSAVSSKAFASNAAYLWLDIMSASSSDPLSKNCWYVWPYSSLIFLSS